MRLHRTRITLVGVALLVAGAVAVIVVQGPRSRAIAGGFPYTTCDVEAAYKHVTGMPFHYRRPLDLRRMGGGLTEELADRKDGDFSFFVDVDPPTDPVFQSMSRRTGKPDANGIYWCVDLQELPPGPSTWTATRYRGNVKLIWWSKRTLKDRQQVDGHWRTLSRVLESMTQGGKCG